MPIRGTRASMTIQIEQQRIVVARTSRRCAMLFFFFMELALIATQFHPPLPEHGARRMQTLV
jgi:hypothetical protein